MSDSEVLTVMLMSIPSGVFIGMSLLAWMSDKEWTKWVRVKDDDDE